MRARFSLSRQHSILTIHCVTNSHPDFIPKTSAYTKNIQHQCLSITFYIHVHFNKYAKYNVTLQIMKVYQIITYILQSIKQTLYIWY
jgi:hypothetical protein